MKIGFLSLGGPDDYDVSPDGQEVCYSMNADPVPAVSTNADLFVVSIAGGQSRKITLNPGADASPHCLLPAGPDRPGRRPGHRLRVHPRAFA